ncbi:MAG: LLM class F420-dependent oxidoreductase [Candidatus Rokubacteria bacterium]|nr:LLM class F420-dependent oxidoreductase [Candidatus Rokubacteria bacterium]
MEFGCHLPQFGPVATRHNIVTFARRMEALGYDSLWISDHVVIPWTIRSRYPYNPTGQFPLAPNAHWPEPLITLGLVAAVTERVKLGTTILVLPHRHPVLTAKMIATLDDLSGGRVVLGAGVGWMEEEITILGAPFAKRGAWSDEAIKIMRTCWSQEKAAFTGQFFSFDAIGCFPQPVRKTIPILIGGNTRPALRRVAELGDGWHAAFPAPDKLEEGLRILREECKKADRRFEDLAITLRAGVSIRKGKSSDRRPMTGTPEEIVSDIRRYKALGVTTLLLESRQRDLDDMIQIHETFARDIRPAV